MGLPVCFYISMFILFVYQKLYIIMNIFFVCRIADLINVIAHDFHGPWAENTGHQAALYHGEGTWPLYSQVHSFFFTVKVFAGPLLLSLIVMNLFSIISIILF